MFVKVSNAKVVAVSSEQTLGKVAAKKSLGSFNYDDRGNGFLYVSVRACTADVPNLNLDMLPGDELKTAYKTFIGSPVYVNHKNSNLDRARGFIIDACYHKEDPNDKWIEILMEMDEETFPKLCGYIRSGEIDTVSMGLNCQSTTCSVCGNVAESPADFCNHIKTKGSEKYDGEYAYEICNGIQFFEESWVYDPADPTAKVVEKEAKVSRLANKKHAQEDQDTVFTVTFYPSTIEYNGTEKEEETFTSSQEGYDDYFETLDEAKECIKDFWNYADRYHDDELYYEAGPLKAPAKKYVAVVDECEYDEDYGPLDIVNEDVYDEQYPDDSDLKPAYEQTGELGDYVESNAPNNPDIHYSYAPDSWETFYIEWDELDLESEQADILYDEDIPSYCKVRVSGHDSTDNDYKDNTYELDLDDYTTFAEVSQAVNNCYKEWQEYVEDALETDFSKVATTGMTRTKRLEKQSQWVDLIKPHEILQTSFDGLVQNTKYTVTDQEMYDGTKCYDVELTSNASYEGYDFGFSFYAFVDSDFSVSGEDCELIGYLNDNTFTINVPSGPHSVLFEENEAYLKSNGGREDFASFLYDELNLDERLAAEVADNINYINTMNEINKAADNMVNKRRIPEEVDMQDTDRVCPICGSPDFDGQYCDVCEYVEYAPGFGDVDTEKAQENNNLRDDLSEEEDIEDVQEDANEGKEDEEEKRANYKCSFELDSSIDFDDLSQFGYAEDIDYKIAANRVCVRSASLANLLKLSGLKEL